MSSKYFFYADVYKCKQPHTSTWKPRFQMAHPNYANEFIFKMFQSANTKEVTWSVKQNNRKK